MQMLYVYVNSVQFSMLHDLQFVNVGRGCRRREYGHKRHSIQAVELSQTAVQIVSNPPAPVMGARFNDFLGQVGYADPLPLIKAGDVETNPGPTNTHKQVWIIDICQKQIHVRKQISIRCNRI